MEAQLERPSHGHHHHERGAHSVEVVEGGEQKISVLKKVKDKAKRIKDTIKKHGHGHQHHHHEEEEDPEVHGAPTYESSVVRSISLPKENINFENPNQNQNQNHHHERERETPSPPAMKQNINAVTESPADGPHSPNNTPVGIQDSSDSSNKPLSESASEYAHKFAETLAPVYGKVAGATTGTGVINKEYLSEQLKPGDEDKALSEAITGALLHKKKDEEAPPPPKAKVTVSKEVAEWLGTDRESKREGEDAVEAGEESTGQTVGERLQNAVTTWLAGSTGMQTAQDSVNNAFVNDAGGAGPKQDEPRRHQ